MARLPAAAHIVVLFLGVQVQGQTTRPDLHLEEVLGAARLGNPGLQATQAMAEAAALREPVSSAYPDPVFQVGVMNVGLPELNADMAMSMAPSLQLTQRVPFPGKRHLAHLVAVEDRRLAELGAEEQWWRVRSQVSSFFYDLYALDQQLSQMRETWALLQDFRQVAKAMYSAGRGRQADVLRADVEVARIDGDIQAMEARRRGVAAKLNAALGVPAATPVGSPVLGDLSTGLPSAEELLTWADESRPLLAQGRSRVSRAESERQLAGRQIWPDVTVGVAYGQRDRGNGAERMGSLMLGLSLPVHAGKRQHAVRDAASAAKRSSEAVLASLEASVDAEVAGLLAELDRAEALIGLYRSEVIPEARAMVVSAFSSYRVGSVDFMTLVDAQMTLNRFEGELFVLYSDFGKGVAALESAIGRSLPMNGPPLMEVR